MKYAIHYFNCGKASKSWIIDIEARFPTKRQCTWETAAWTSEGIILGHSLVWSAIKFWWMIRKEIKARQELAGEFELK